MIQNDHFDNKQKRLLKLNSDDVCIDVAVTMETEAVARCRKKER